MRTTSPHGGGGWRGLTYIDGTLLSVLNIIRENLSKIPNLK
jgi:hypothetical protein